MRRLIIILLALLQLCACGGKAEKKPVYKLDTDRAASAEGEWILYEDDCEYYINIYGLDVEKGEVTYEAIIVNGEEETVISPIVTLVYTMPDKNTLIWGDEPVKLVWNEREGQWSCSWMGKALEKHVCELVF